jgi:hypothetical protein
MRTVTFEIWDVDTANVISDHPTEVAALAYVRSVISRHGRGAVTTWELARIAGGRDAETIAIGDKLADRACGSVPV